MAEADDDAAKKRDARLTAEKLVKRFAHATDLPPEVRAALIESVAEDVLEANSGPEAVIEHRPSKPAIPFQRCPKCQQSAGRLLEASSEHAYVNYYRCESCGVVWTVPKSPEGKNVTPTVITRPKDESPAS